MKLLVTAAAFVLAIAICAFLWPFIICGLEPHDDFRNWM